MQSGLQPIVYTCAGNSQIAASWAHAAPARTSFGVKPDTFYDATALLQQIIEGAMLKRHEPHLCQTLAEVTGMVSLSVQFLQTCTIFWNTTEAPCGEAADKNRHTAGAGAACRCTPHWLEELQMLRVATNISRPTGMASSDMLTNSSTVKGAAIAATALPCLAPRCRC